MDLKIKYHDTKLKHENQVQIDQDKSLLFESFQNYESFYAEVYKQMFQVLFSYGMQICGNKELVLDCIQELFSGLWKNQKTLTKIKSIKPYLLKCIKRKIKRELGKGNRLPTGVRFEFESSQEVKLIKDQEYLKKQFLLKRALITLTERQREAIYLRFYSNLPYEEVAQVLKIKTKATYKLIHRALSSLKAAIADA